LFRHNRRLLSTILLFGAAATGYAEQPAEVTIDFATQRQTIVGFGASGRNDSAANFGKLTTENQKKLYDLFFDPDTGIGLSMVRSELFYRIEPCAGVWDWSKDDAQVRLMIEAKKRGVKYFWSACWGPPAWLKDNQDVNNGGHLRSEHHEDYADILSRYVREYKNRFGIDSHIITNAHRIRRGQMPDMRGSDPSSDFHFVERDDPEKIAATLVKLVRERIPERFRLDPIRDVQVLCPMNRGSLGVRELNTSLQKVLNPARPGQPAVERFGWRFQTGDKVIQTENDYDKDVFNGDVGIVERINAVEQLVAVRFDERLVKYDFGELDEISLAYAITIHKSQGSEFPAVVIPLATQHYMLLQRNLIYTGITRGKRLLVLIGQKKALGIAVRNDRPQRRYTGLLASLEGKKGTGGSAVDSKTASQSRVVPASI
jgi:hypothetical protein